MDFWILYWIQDYVRNDFLDTIMPLITTLVDYGFIWLLIGVILVIIKKYRLYGIECLSAVALAGGLINLVIKPLTDRMRPFLYDPSITLLLEAPTSSSFPSGHTAASFAALIVLCSMPIKIYWKIMVVTIAVLVAFSRLYLFFHFPTDVLVGMIIGVCSGLACVILGKKFLAPRLSQTPKQKLVE